MKASLTILLLALALLVCGSTGCANEGGDEEVKAESQSGSGLVRRPVFAGDWYSSDPEVLAREIDRYLSDAEVTELEGELVGVISPHAGYRYSGAVAAHGYSYLLDESFDSVVVVAPSHRFPLRGASVYGGDGYMTPLGTVPVDRELASAIEDESQNIRYEPMAHTAEHSLELQVPFLQRTLKDFQIVPIVMGTQGGKSVGVLAARIAQAVASAGAAGKRVLLVASTDLSHFHDYDTAEALDSVILDRVRAFDPEGLLAEIEAGNCEACGAGPMATVMVAARALGADLSCVVKYANSGDVSGDRSQVVGYMSAVLTRRSASDARSGTGASARDAGQDAPAEGGVGASSGAPGDGGSAAAPHEGLSDDEKRVLLTLARGRIEAKLGAGRPPDAAHASPALDKESGAFVTIHKKGQLRGCIGYVRAVKPLREAISDMAIQAAFHDPRFPPVARDELAELDIEISVLSPLVRVEDVSEIEVGRHGLVIQDGMNSGLLLPQVPVEQGWDRVTFLEHTCMKAGLPPGAWKREGVVLLKFTAEVFGEAEFGYRG